MVEQADDAPLLFWAEGPAVSVPEPVEPSAWKGSPWGGKGDPAAAALAGADPEQVEEDQILAVFVVTFDPRTVAAATSQIRGERFQEGQGDSLVSTCLIGGLQLPPDVPGLPMCKL
uniref:Uncharacterized protein n=1 Tax=Sphaerodactylus townsendi TaxID=933632 RepID=A0ACB8FN43_9SAUR